MPRTNARDQAQLGLDEKVVNNADLEAALEERLARKIAVGYAQKAYKEAADAANVEIAKLELPDGMAIRAGRFRVSRSAVSARTVSFETKPTSRVTITFLGEDEDAEAAGDDAFTNGKEPAPKQPDPTHIDTLRNRAADARKDDPPQVHP